MLICRAALSAVYVAQSIGFIVTGELPAIVVRTGHSTSLSLPSTCRCSSRPCARRLLAVAARPVGYLLAGILNIKGAVTRSGSPLDRGRRRKGHTRRCRATTRSGGLLSPLRDDCIGGTPASPRTRARSAQKHIARRDTHSSVMIGWATYDRPPCRKRSTMPFAAGAIFRRLDAGGPATDRGGGRDGREFDTASIAVSARVTRSDFLYTVLAGRGEGVQATARGTDVILGSSARVIRSAAVAVYESRPYPRARSRSSPLTCLSSPPGHSSRVETHPSPSCAACCVGLTHRLVEADQPAHGIIRRAGSEDGSHAFPVRLAQDMASAREEGHVHPAGAVAAGTRRHDRRPPIETSIGS
jgi:hypothetical protein